MSPALSYSCAPWETGAALTGLSFGLHYAYEIDRAHADLLAIVKRLPRTSMPRA